MFKKKITWIIIAIVIVVIFVVYKKNQGNESEYTTEKVEKGDVLRTVSATGIFKSSKESDLAFEASGKVRKINVKEGDEVKEGQILAFLDQASALATLRGYQADLKIQEDALLLKRRDWNALKPEERDSAKASVDKYKSLVESSRANLRKNIIYASQDGVVTKVDISEGEMATANVAVIKVIKEGEWEIEVDVAESDITEVSLDQKAEITFDALSSSEIFEGKVVEIDPASTVIQDVVYYKVKLEISNIDSRFKRGMSVDVDIETARKEKTLLVSTRAIKEDSEGKYVEILNDKKEKEKKYVETGISGDESETEIKSGILEGQEVIVFEKKKEK